VQTSQLCRAAEIGVATGLGAEELVLWEGSLHVQIDLFAELEVFEVPLPRCVVVERKRVVQIQVLLLRLPHGPSESHSRLSVFFARSVRTT
jgi:hypothetical protein